MLKLIYYSGAQKLSGNTLFSFELIKCNPRNKEF